MKALAGITAFFGFLFLSIALALLPYYIGGSIIVSGVKAVSDNCGTRYPIESFGLAGDWFCPSKK